MKLICLGKIKEEYVKKGIEDYTNRIKKHYPFEIIELKESKIDSIIALEKEKDDILSKIKEKDYVILLDRCGKEQDTLTFSKSIENLINNNNNIVFIIGSSYGIHQTIKERANLILSFSKMTFPHQLFRLLFVEQLYRSIKIIKNEPYHK